jgi:hypothetical protein
MIVLFRPWQATRGAWRHYRPVILPLSRALIPVFVALTVLLVRSSALAAAIAATLNIVFTSWVVWSGVARSRATKGWQPWVP